MDKTPKRGILAPHSGEKGEMGGKSIIAEQRRPGSGSRRLYAHALSVRILDGPDEVPDTAVARRELNRHR